MPLLQEYPQADRIIILSAAVMIILAGLKMAGGFIGPFLLAIFAAIIFSVLSRYFQTKGFSPSLSHWMSFSVFIGCLLGLFLLVIVSVSPLIRYIPAIQEIISEHAAKNHAYLETFGVDISAYLSFEAVSGSMQFFSTDTIYAIISQFSALFIIIITTLFLLLEATRYSQKISKILDIYQQDLGVNIQHFGSMVIDYVVIRTKVNLVTGVGFGIVLAVLGVQDPWLWGIIMFIMTFIPYLGFLIGLIPPMILAWVDVSPMAAIIILIAANVINFISESFIFPKLAGNGMELSPSIVFISMIVWGFFFGFSGVLVAVPLTVLLKIVLESYPETKWISMFIGIDPDERKEIEYKI